NSSKAALQVALVPAGFQPFAHFKNPVDELGLPGDSKDSLIGCGHHFAGKLSIAMDRPGPRQCQPLPELGDAALVVMAKFPERDYQASRFAGRPEPHIHMVKTTRGTHETGRLDDSLTQFSEIVEIVGQLESIEPAGVGRRLGTAIPLVDQHQVEIAVISQLASTQLAEGEEHVARGLSRTGTIGERWHSKALRQWRFLQ